jgi:formate dehydrogenase major subunit
MEKVIMVNITIDGNSLQVPDGTTVLEAARSAGIKIPTLCDHPELTPYGGCRLCLVEVEGARTLQPSCTLPASNNMIVRTNTDRVQSARKFVLTLIFSERNHFCPFCQVSGGDCELQNAAYAEGMTHWQLPPNWTPYEVDASNPYFVLDNNRCILCRRCVRACGELVGNFTLGFEERGARSFLVADLGVPLGQSTCVSCGTCVQVCPTGAIIDRNSAYRGRVTDVQTQSTICVGCSVGCGINVITRDNGVVRIDGNWDAEVNGGLLCKVGRFLPMEESRERITTPLVRKDGKLKAATWDEALNVVASHMKALAGFNGTGIAAAASDRLSAEALHLFKTIFADGLHSDMVTTLDGSSTAASSDLADELGKSYEGSLSSLQEADCVVVAGTDLLEENPVAAYFIKRILPMGVNLVVVDSNPNQLDAFAVCTLKAKKGTENDVLAGVLAAANQDAAGLQAAAGKSGIAAATLEEAARLVAGASKPAIVFGKSISPRAANDLAGKVNGAVLNARPEANSLAAAQYRLEKSFQFGARKAAYIAIGDEEPTQRLVQELGKAEFLVVQASYVSLLTAAANVVLPVATWLEQAGHFVNIDGHVQEAACVIAPAEDVWANQKVFEALAGCLGVSVNGGAWKEALSQRVPAVALQGLN